MQNEVWGQHILQLSPVVSDHATCCWWGPYYVSSNLSIVIILYPYTDIVISTSFGNMYACHGGLSPSLETLESIESIDRLVEPEQNADLMDIVWSDPISDEVLIVYTIILCLFFSFYFLLG